MASQRLQLTWYNKDKALIPTETGKYGYTWVEPSDPRYCETHTLVLDDYVQGTQTPKSDEFAYSQRADLDPQDDNLLILGESGDVLEALTRVPELAEKYVGQVKLIYIDPPFNTAQTFASYEDNLEHSIWLTMMRDRLLHMKKLLADDGSIWIHLDDVENHRMRLLLDDIFGSKNLIAEICLELNPKGRQLKKHFAKSNDTVYVYAKNFDLTDIDATSFDELDINDFPLRLADGTPYRLLPLRNTNKKFNPKTRPNLYYPLYVDIDDWSVHLENFAEAFEVWPVFGDGSPAVWRWHKYGKKMDTSALRGKEVNGKNGKRIDIDQIDVAGPNRKKKLKTIWLSEAIGNSDSAKDEIKDLIPGLPPFDTPKPERLLERILFSGSKPGDIVLDVFAGSGSTAAVAQKMGRRWVTCELLESTFTTFTLPRLKKVVNDEDPGGITRTKRKRVDTTKDGLPDGVSPEDAAKFTRVLNKLIKDDPDLKTSADVEALKAASKTKYTKKVLNWRGGGGFQVAHLSPACFDYDPELDRVMLTTAATGETLIKSVAANLGFTLLHPDDDYIFDARRGNALLKVIEGVATVEIVDWLSSQIQPGETIVIAATSVMDGVRQHLRRTVKGSQVIAIPDDLFRYNKDSDL